jgi:N-acetylneuraminic acid mutarotase
LFRLKI